MVDGKKVARDEYTKAQIKDFNKAFVIIPMKFK